MKALRSQRRNSGEIFAAVTLPGGLWLADRRLCQAGIHALTGDDEAHLLSLRDILSPARWASELLARTLTHIEEISPVPLETVQALTVGDREALLLHLRRLTFGDKLSCVLDCPQCDVKLDFDLETRDLILPPYESPAYWYRVSLPERALIVTFRLPTGADQEAVADLAKQGPEAAATALLIRCLQSIRQGDDELDPLPEELLSWLVDPMSALMSERDPQAELLLNNRCPTCEHKFDVLLDMTRYLADEINQRIRHLYREVHLLAWYYHWSEADIMAMTRPHRQIYLDLLDETLSEVSP